MTKHFKFIVRIVLFCFVLNVIAPGLSIFHAPPAYAGCGCGSCFDEVDGCKSHCVCTSKNETAKTVKHLKDEFVKHREWLVKVVFEQNLLPALMLFAEQMTAMAMHQVMAVGTFLDAKHQLETQRLFQELTARAHKDYQPSEGMCAFGTNVRSLAASDRNTDLSTVAVSNRVLQRELLSGDAVAGAGRSSDYLSRIAQFRELYCNKDDNGKGLGLFCPDGSKDKARLNNDINYAATLDAPLTLQLDFTEEGKPEDDANLHIKGVSKDEEDVFALAANLYAHNVAPTVPMAFLSDENGVQNPEGVTHYMNIRSVAAKRSVARNSFAAIAAMKSQGEKEVQPYLYALVKDMGISNPEEIKNYLGDRPSYHAQMEMLTKKLYQNPMFYTELYDKPANVARKAVSMQAIDLMQRRDIYRSMLRSEAILSVMLETALIEQQEAVSNEINRLPVDDEPITLP